MRKIKKSYRKPRSANEKRINCDPEHEPFVRGSRKANSLPDAWDDRPTVVTKCWKDKRKKQHRCEVRGRKHSIVFKTNCEYGVIWHLKQHFMKHSIPFRVEKKYKIETKVITGQMVWMPVGNEPYEQVIRERPRKNGAKKTLTKFKTVVNYRVKCDFVWKDFPEPKIVRKSIFLGFEITWWTNKDIGIDKTISSILRKNQ